MHATRYTLLTLALVMCTVSARCEPGFYLKPHDRVVFCGDGVEQYGCFTRYVDAFVATRFPTLDVTILQCSTSDAHLPAAQDPSLTNTVRRLKPTVVVFVPAVDDGARRSFDHNAINRFADALNASVDGIRKAMPGIRLTLLKPAPYDDITRPPGPNDGGNAIVVHYSECVSSIASAIDATVADMNAPLISVLKNARGIDAVTAATIIPDQVHPGPAAHLLMASALARVWNAPKVVSIVEIDARARSVRTEVGTSVSRLAGDPSDLSWTQTDQALPMPADARDPAVALVLKSSDLRDEVNDERLTVSNLTAPRYVLKIDGRSVGVFTRDALEQGLDLTALATPMMEQAREVARLTELRYAALARQAQRVRASGGSALALETVGASAAREPSAEELLKQRRGAAQPKPHRFELTPAG
jgi:hypothetical protein